MCIDKDSRLYDLQKLLAKNFFDKIPIADNVYGFVKGYSYRDFLEPHIRKDNHSFYLRLDIRDFFDTITKNILIDTLSFYISNNLKSKKEILGHIVEAITLDGKLPQGAVTSPAVSNIVFRQFDIRIQKYCRKLNICYSRYADDMLFSSANDKLHADFFIKSISIILKPYFILNSTKVIKNNGEISLNGFVVGKNIRLSRKRKKDISKVIYLFHKGGKPSDISKYIDELNNDETGFLYRNKVDDFSKDEEVYFYNIDSLINYLAGYRSFLIDWIPEKENEVVYNKHINLLKKIERIIEYIIDRNK